VNKSTNDTLTILKSVALTDAGRVRSLNEDSVAVVSPDGNPFPEKGTLLVLADGLGGYNAGEVASRMVISELPRLYFNAPGSDYVKDLEHAVAEINRVVHKASQESKHWRGMCSTLVTCLVVNESAIFLNVGDSRGYLFREESLVFRTEDHALERPTFGVRERGGWNTFSHVLTRAIGVQPDVTRDVTIHGIAPGDTILLCSDGLSDVITDEEIMVVLTDRNISDAAERLVMMAKEKKSDDNISVIISRVVDVPVLGNSRFENIKTV
jgi:serine/threonine protein phosphatase PrpC